MPYWVYGNDRETGERDSFYSEARDDQAARAEASAQGLFVERVVYADAPPSTTPGLPVAAPEVAVPLELPAQAIEPIAYLSADAPSPYVPLDEHDSLESSPPSLSIVALWIAESLCELSCGFSLLAIPVVLLIFRRPVDLVIYFVACVLSFFYNLALAIVFRYVRRQMSR